MSHPSMVVQEHRTVVSAIYSAFYLTLHKSEYGINISFQH